MAAIDGAARRNATNRHPGPAVGAGVKIAIVAVLSAILIASAAQAKPNFVVILTDDETLADMRVMPRTQRIVGSHGLTFDRFFDEYSLCSPSRSTFLTGRYAHNTGIHGNALPMGGAAKFIDLGLESGTLAVKMKAAGYRTGLIGKYLNEFGKETSPTHVPPGWSFWSAPVTEAAYGGYVLDVNGVLASPTGYITDELAAQAVRFIAASRGSTQPFFLYFATTAPHFPSVSAPRHATLFAGETEPRTPNFNETDISDKPTFMRRDPLSDAEIAAIDQQYRQRLRALQAVDEAVDDIRGALSAAGHLDDTYIIFWSDNGFGLGQHRQGGFFLNGTHQVGGKELAFENNIHLPLMIRGPGVRVGHETRMAVNVDLAPTILDLAGVAGAGQMDGRSLAPILRGGSIAWRRSFPLGRWQGSPASAVPEDRYPSFVGVRTVAWTYVHWADGEIELYDHANDPSQLDNLGGDPGHADLRAQLDALAGRLSTCAADTCRSIENQPAP